MLNVQVNSKYERTKYEYTNIRFAIAFVCNICSFITLSMTLSFCCLYLLTPCGHCLNVFYQPCDLFLCRTQDRIRVDIRDSYFLTSCGHCLNVIIQTCVLFFIELRTTIGRIKVIYAQLFKELSIRIQIIFQAEVGDYRRVEILIYHMCI